MFYNILPTSRGGVETRYFETETRPDFLVATPRRDTRLYNGCFGLRGAVESEPEVGVACFWLESEPK